MPARRGRRSFETGTGREVKEARVDVILQRVEEKIGRELNVFPSHIYRYGVNNIFQRSFAYLLGWKDDGEPQKIAVTEGGLLKVTAYPKIAEEYERNPTTDTDGYVEISGTEVITETFSEVVNTIDIFAKDNDIYFQLSKDGITFGKKILLRGSINEVISLDFSCKAVKLSNVVTDGTANGKYQVVGYR